ncbi:MAG: hypothetical protein ACYSTF_07500 [Planctomycetota bacterium]|jgi:hypothetical protein
MDAKTLKVIGIACLIACCVLLFVAYERYQTNADSVRAMNQFRQSMPVGGMVEGLEIRPAMPAATKYALLFAVISAGAGIVCFVYAKPQGAASADDTTEKLS